MRQVNSSNIEAYIFSQENEGDDEGVLRIRFRSGRTYRYEHLPTEIAEQLDRIADDGGSVGSYFSREIRPVYQGIEEKD